MRFFFGWLFITFGALGAFVQLDATLLNPFMWPDDARVIFALWFFVVQVAVVTA